VVNLDDPYGERLAGEITKIPVIGFGTAAGCAVRPDKIELSAEGIEGTILTPTGRLSIHSHLTGSFNLLNILAAVGVAEQLGLPSHAVTQGIEAVTAVPGRLERVPGKGAAVFVDYAHTPNALQNVLAALHHIRTGKIVTIMGCGGDRDKTKRPIMGREAAAGSNFVVVTSDNPRSEDPQAIIDQVVEGVRKYGYTLLSEHLNEHPLPSGYFRVIPDRREAIAWTVRHLESNDMLLVAGKGHETYQEIKGVRYPFDDREVVKEELKKLSGQSDNGQHQNQASSRMGGRT
jgi:UDP-N-acetylmuramyl-tripeptide synthetase